MNAKTVLTTESHTCFEMSHKILINEDFRFDKMFYDNATGNLCSSKVFGYYFLRSSLLIKQNARLLDNFWWGVAASTAVSSL